jgi:hypothetical protein
MKMSWTAMTSRAQDKEDGMLASKKITADDGLIDVSVGWSIQSSIQGEPLAEMKVRSFPVANMEHRSEAPDVFLGDVRGRAHLKQPLAHR